MYVSDSKINTEIKLLDQDLDIQTTKLSAPLIFANHSAARAHNAYS